MWFNDLNNRCICPNQYFPNIPLNQYFANIQNIPLNLNQFDEYDDFDIDDENMMRIFCKFPLGDYNFKTDHQYGNDDGC